MDHKSLFIRNKLIISSIGGDTEWSELSHTADVRWSSPVGKWLGGLRIC